MTTLKTTNWNPTFPKRFCYLCIVFFIININVIQAQKHPSAALQISSTTQGFLPPQMTTTQRDAIANPANGLMIYNTDNDAIDIYSASNRWVEWPFSSNPITVDSVQLDGTVTLSAPYSYSVSGGVEDKSSTRVNYYKTNANGETPILVDNSNGVATAYTLPIDTFVASNRYLLIGVKPQGGVEVFSSPIYISSEVTVNTDLSMTESTGETNGVTSGVEVTLSNNIIISATTNRVRTDFVHTSFENFFASRADVQNNEISYYQTMGDGNEYLEADLEFVFDQAVKVKKLGHNSGVEGASQQNYFSQVRATFYDASDQSLGSVTDNISSITEFFELSNPQPQIPIKRIVYELNNPLSNYTGANEFYITILR